MSAVLRSLVEAAVAGTGSIHGWIVAADGGGLAVVAATGPAAAGVDGRRLVGGGGPAGHVIGSGQPLALAPRPGDAVLDDELAELLGEPLRSIVCVPCSDDRGVLGALQLMNKVDGPFSFDDVELATLLATVAGAALASVAPAPAVPAPADLAAALGRLSAADAERYARVAVTVEALLGEA